MLFLPHTTWPSLCLYMQCHSHFKSIINKIDLHHRSQKTICIFFIPLRIFHLFSAYWFTCGGVAWIIHLCSGPQHAGISLCEVVRTVKHFASQMGRRLRRCCGDWSDFVSGEELLRSDYLGRTKCFCWWRVAVICGSWEIDGTHGALEHWLQPWHWQSMAWLVMRENEVKWANVRMFLPLLTAVFVSFVLTSSAQEWLIISRSKVWACVCVCVSKF